MDGVKHLLEVIICTLINFEDSVQAGAPRFDMLVDITPKPVGNITPGAPLALLGSLIWVETHKSDSHWPPPRNGNPGAIQSDLFMPSFEVTDPGLLHLHNHYWKGHLIVFIACGGFLLHTIHEPTGLVTQSATPVSQFSSWFLCVQFFYIPSCNISKAFA